MLEPRIWKRRRDVFRSQRATLSEKYDKNPNDLRLALKIKTIDDEIAACTEYMMKQRQLYPGDSATAR
jgi:hypothetical protein